tara:strand:+ start:1913 stop:2308 length:396 start_codon:yes stop_codon:yes gene_type:complete
MSDGINETVITTQDALDASSDWSHLTYTWAVTELKTSTSGGHSRAVTQVYWSKTGTDNEGRSGVFRGATPLSAESVNEADFIDFASLPEATIIGWVKSAIAGDTHPNERIQIQINDISNPVTDEELPWSTD